MSGGGESIAAGEGTIKAGENQISGIRSGSADLISRPRHFLSRSSLVRVQRELKEGGTGDKDEEKEEEERCRERERDV